MALSDAMVEQLYVAPDWIGRGLGGRLARARQGRVGPTASTCTASRSTRRAAVLRAPRVRAGRVRRRLAATMERQPDVLYRWRPTPARMTPPPSRIVVSADGTPIAVFTSGDGPAARPRPRRPRRPHDVPGRRAAARRARSPSTRSTGAVGARRATRRRTRSSASSRTSRRSPRRWPPTRATPVDVVGHSYGGRCALGARAADRRDPAGRLATRARRRRRAAGTATPGLAASSPSCDRGRRRRGAARGVPAAGRRDGRGGPGRVPGRSGLAAPGRGGRTRSCASSRRPRRPRPASRRSAPSGSRSSRSSAATACRPSRDGDAALDERLADGRVVVIPGARHAAHHTHPDAFVEAVARVPRRAVTR